MEVLAGGKMIVILAVESLLPDGQLAWWIKKKKDNNNKKTLHRIGKTISREMKQKEAMQLATFEDEH